MILELDTQIREHGGVEGPVTFKHDELKSKRSEYKKKLGGLENNLKEKTKELEKAEETLEKLADDLKKTEESIETLKGNSREWFYNKHEWDLGELWNILGIDWDIEFKKERLILSEDVIPLKILEKNEIIKALIKTKD